MYLILPAALGPGIYSAFNRNEHQKIFLWAKRDWRVRLADKLTAVYGTGFPRQHEMLIISQLYSPPQHVTGAALLFIYPFSRNFYSVTVKVLSVFPRIA
jgi:hypothetical protein